MSVLSLNNLSRPSVRPSLPHTIPQAKEDCCFVTPHFENQLRLEARFRRRPNRPLADSPPLLFWDVYRSSAAPAQQVVGGPRTSSSSTGEVGGVAGTMAASSRMLHNPKHKPIIRDLQQHWSTLSPIRAIPEHVCPPPLDVEADDWTPSPPDLAVDVIMPDYSTCVRGCVVRGPEDVVTPPSEWEYAHLASLQERGVTMAGLSLRYRMIHQILETQLRAGSDDMDEDEETDTGGDKAETGAGRQAGGSGSGPQGCETQMMRLGAERYSVPEVLFSPADIGLQQAGIVDMIVASIEACPLDLRPLLWQNIVLTGGNTLFPGFEARLCVTSSPYHTIIPSAHHPITQSPLGSHWFAFSV